ncbi:PilN domain-containing protein [Parahaliea mediterranea]|uniref:PilN domain-containing protein n=1 Tax=Parahaliea mediterranea TaxID=651086 RepID=A0A939IKQ3_9GAMM|nr:PilN domain-containing protein [Parahaliea mediterranea]MBN7795168.1 PilN domain-containing protein [Parahaliea mediterranea]
MILDSSSQQWQLFGFDVRHIGRHWQHAWAEFLWGDQSPVRARLDEVVLLHSESGSEFYHSGRTVEPTDAKCEAILLPAELVLTKSLRLPRAAEAELEAAMALEVGSKSPFPADDTASGWTLLGRDDDRLEVQLAIVSLSATMRYLGRHYDIHDVGAREVWARLNERPIVLQGFGEDRRLARYKRRLLRMGGLLAGGLCLLLAMVLLSVGGKYLVMKQYQDLSARVTAQTRDAAEQRESLSSANQIIASVEAVSQAFPSPHVELARLTQLLGDDAYIAQFAMNGNEIRLRGRSADAAAVMERLTAVPEYAEVSAAQGGITKLGNTGLEQFYVSIRLRGEGDA